MESQKFVSPIKNVVLFDESDTVFFQDYLKKTVIINGLLGDYNANGEYVIADDIKNDLISCEKDIISKTETLYEVSANCADYVFNFNIVIEKTDERKKCASLFLLEKVNSFNVEYQRKIKTFIAAYEDFDDIYFVDKVVKIFHLHNKDGDKKDYDKDQNAKKLKARRDLQKSIAKRLLLEGEELSKIYLQKMITILENCGEKGEFLLKRYKKLLLENESKLKKGDVGYYFKLKTMLDEVIFEGGVKFAPKEKKAIDILRKRYTELEKPFLVPPKAKVAEEKKIFGKKNDAKKGSNKKANNKKSNAKKNVDKPASDNKEQTNNTNQAESKYSNQKKMENSGFDFSKEFLFDSIFSEFDEDYVDISDLMKEEEKKKAELAKAKAEEAPAPIIIEPKEPLKEEIVEEEKKPNKDEISFSI